MAATYRILPDPGYRDGLGSLAQPWEEIHGREIFLDGKPVASRPIDAGWIEQGILPPERITHLLPETILGVGARTLAEISADAVLGASDPTARINAGLTLLLGTKIADGSIPASKLSGFGILEVSIEVGELGGFRSGDWSLDTGWSLYGDGPIFNRGFWRGITQGTIQCGSFFVAPDGHGGIGTDNKGIRWDTLGRIWFATPSYDESPMQFDKLGNIFVTDTTQSLSAIDLGAINEYVRGVIPNVASGAYSGNVAFTPKTRGARIYYTDDGTDPSDVTNGSRTKYTAPIAVNPGAGAPITIKTVAEKLGAQGAVEEWTYTYPPDPGGAVASPVFTPTGDYYYPSNGILSVELTSATAGATIRYTLDGSAPTGASAVYVAPIQLPVGQTQIKAFAQKAGLADSVSRESTYVVAEGSNDGGNGEPTGGGGGHGHLPP